MKNRIVIALGGTALGEEIKEQISSVRNSSKAIADLIEDGHDVVIVHGSGPQIGMIDLAFEIASKSVAKTSPMPMEMCVAMSQGFMGYFLQNTLCEELHKRGIDKKVATIVTQVVVNANDRAFKDPTKPIGAFYTEDEAEEMLAGGFVMKDDSGRGFRRVVPSPKPVDILELETIRTLLDAGQIPIAAGGGGIPVIKIGSFLKGASAVVDKDFTSAKLAELLDADTLILLTPVEKVAINFNTPDVQWLDKMNIADCERYIGQGQFASGSMLPKMQAALEFVKAKPGRKALITQLSKARDGIAGKTGTVITA